MSASVRFSSPYPAHIILLTKRLVGVALGQLGKLYKYARKQLHIRTQLG